MPRSTLPAVTVGIDFGTLSGRALVVAVEDGTELGSAVHPYPHGVVDQALPATGRPLPPDWALQIPEDWREVLRHAVPEALREAGVRPEQVVGVAADFTSCTVLPTTADGTPLCELPEFAGRPHAYPKLWRHHAAQPEADLIARRAEETGSPGRPATAARSPASGSTPRRSNCSGRTPGSTRPPTASSRRATGSCGS